MTNKEFYEQIIAANISAEITAKAQYLAEMNAIVREITAAIAATPPTIAEDEDED